VTISSFISLNALMNTNVRSATFILCKSSNSCVLVYETISGNTSFNSWAIKPGCFGLVVHFLGIISQTFNSSLYQYCLGTSDKTSTSPRVYGSISVLMRSSEVVFQREELLTRKQELPARLIY
jgi:hypothetical protein